MCITNARCFHLTIAFLLTIWGTDFSLAIHEHSWKTQLFKNELRKWKGLPPLNFAGSGVIVNEGKPGRPPGLQPEGFPDQVPGDAADTKFAAVPDVGNDVLDIIYNPLTDISSRPSELYNLPEVDKTGKFACYDKDGIGPIDFIPTANAIQVGLIDPADADTTLMQWGRRSHERTQFYNVMMAIGGGIHGNDVPCRKVYKNLNAVWSAQKKVLSDPYNTSLTTEMMQAAQSCVCGKVFEDWLQGIQLQDSKLQDYFTHLFDKLAI